jgi:alanyl aminopeptidase
MRRPCLALSAALALIAILPAAVLSAVSEGRLGRQVVPTFQSVRLVLDADRRDYRGSVRIELEAREPATSFQFHAEGLRLERMTLTGREGVFTHSHSLGERGLVTLRPVAPLTPGRYTLAIDFTNDFDTQAASLYRLETGGRSYAFTQFQANDAREAFPCWDEPEFKIPWRLTLVVPEKHLAITNTPPEKITRVRGAKTVVFKKTPPMPSYLVALATGPLETVAIKGMSIPGRVVTVQGASRFAAEAIRMTPPLLAALERYFGSRYPYEKLDLIAVPEYWWGAMENPGAVVFADRFLLIDPKASSVQQKSTLAKFIAHELAHMWFGDLVTMEWWDDLWLNESFANWMGNKISDQIYPQFRASVAQLQGAQNAKVTDARLSARAMRQRVESTSNLDQLFDELSYQKGEAVLGMTERWLGPEVFRRGVLNHLKAHEWKTARGDDLWNALSAAAGKDVGLALSTFLDQPGVPLVSVSSIGGNRVRITQSRFLSHGVKSPRATRWQIPVTLKYSDGTATRTQTVLLTQPKQVVTLEISGAPLWLHPNDGEAGYYRWRVDAAMLNTLAEQSKDVLDVRERYGFLLNLSALLNAGAIHGDEYLLAAGKFAGDTDPDVIRAMLGEFHKVREALTHRQEEAFAVYVRRVAAPAVERFGLERRPRESAAVSELRPEVYKWMARYGRDEATLVRAETMAKAYLEDPSAVDPSLAEVALSLAAIRGDRALFDGYRRRFETTQVPIERNATSGLSRASATRGLRTRLSVTRSAVRCGRTSFSTFRTRCID